MKCKKYKEQIVLYLYGELDPDKQEELEHHLQECRECAGDLEYTRQVFLLMDEAEAHAIPETNWNLNWNRIKNGIQKSPGKTSSKAMFLRWIPVTAAVLFVFLLGWLMGRFGSSKKTQLSAPPEISREFILTSLQEYFDSLRPLLVEYANYNNGGKNGSQIYIDESLLKGLLVQNYLLKSMIANNDPGSAQLLEDIELVLREISNREEGDRQAPSMIKKLINQREILFKLDIFKKF